MSVAKFMAVTCAEKTCVIFLSVLMKYWGSFVFCCEMILGVEKIFDDTRNKTKQIVSS